MYRNKKLLSNGFQWVFLLMFLLTGAGSATALPLPSASTIAEGTVVFCSSTSNACYEGEPIIDKQPSQPQIGAGLVQPFMNPIAMWACDLGFSTWTVETFPSLSDGTVSLLCGSSTSGYIHIKSRHDTEWASQMGGPGAWDDYMVWASANALAKPKFSNFQTGQKQCYTTPILVYRIQNGAPKYVKTFNPTVIISTNNKIVITSIPTTTSNCN